MQARPKKEQWRNVSTNVPPELYRELRRRVVKEKKTMSQLLREMLSDSVLVNSANQIRPSWSVDLAQNIAALRAEIVAGKQLREDVLPDLRKEIEDLREDVNSLSETKTITEEEIEPRFLRLYVEKTDVPNDNQPVKEKPAYWPIINRLTEMLGVSRRTA